MLLYSARIIFRDKVWVVLVGCTLFRDSKNNSLFDFFFEGHTLHMCKVHYLLEVECVQEVRVQQVDKHRCAVAEAGH